MAYSHEKGMLLADRDKKNLLMLSFLLRENYRAEPLLWKSPGAFEAFIRDTADGIVFIRIDDPDIQGLKLTKQAAEFYPKIQVAWTAVSGTYAIEAFPYGVDAYLLLPATRESLRMAMVSLAFKKARYREQ